LEAKYNFGNYKFLDNLSGSVFYDYGKITQYKEPGSTANNNYSLSGYGVNFETNISQSIFAKLTWSHTNGGNPGASTQGNDSDGQKNKDRFWFITYYNF
jgi:hypothetical protein